MKHMWYCCANTRTNRNC